MNVSKKTALWSLLAVAVLLGLVLSVRRSWPFKPPPRRAARSLSGQAAPPAPERPVDTYLKTAFYNIRATEYRGKLRKSTVWGGGMTRIGDRYLLAAGDGRLYVFKWDGGTHELTLQGLSGTVPLNADVFAADTGKAVRKRWFRVAGVLAQEVGDHVRVFASHHFWKDAEGCFVVRVSMVEGSRETFLTASESLPWKTVYESAPCLPIKSRSNAFAGHQVGGRLALLNPRDLLLTVGDQEFDGWNAEQDLPQDKTASYGKTVLIHLDRGTSEIYSTGHRNPQGLYVDAGRAIWLTEQGPQGGDELNLLVRGGNYGWPLATYGTDYGSLVWPLSRKQGEHDGFVVPLFSWVPSIAVSSVIGIEKARFPLWKGDLLIASLKGKSLWRVRIRQGRVVYVEPIQIGRRIRDLIEGDDGRIVLWTDEGSLMSLEPAAGTENGELLFSTTCRGCHSAEDETAQGIGPDLSGVVGRRVASAEDYDYSDALKGFGGMWTSERLDAFLKDPRSVVSGTSMQVDGVADPAVRASIIAYLKTLK